MTHVFYRQLTRDYPSAVLGRGITIRDATGKEYIDASGGAAVSCLGHSNPDVLAALHAQIDKLDYAHTGFFTTPAAEELADEMIRHAPAGIGHVYFTSGGSEAVEAALKLARQYFVERGELQRQHFIGRLQGYHGNTLGALSVGGNLWRRKPFAPILLENVHHVSPCYEYRGRRIDETPQRYGERLAQELSNKIDELGGGNVIAFIAETMVGATLGAVPAVPGYFKRVREICDRHGILLILDEVMCGMGRTGTLHACEQEGVTPDLLVVAKGLGGGYAPIGALMVQEKIVKTLTEGSGFFQHGHTYMGHPLACAAALAVQRVIQRDNLLTNVKAQGDHLLRRLGERFGNHPFVGDVRGRGLFQAIELVADRGTKEPFDPARKLNVRIKQEAMDRGLMVYPMGGTVDGVRGDHVLLAPPFIVDAATIDTVVERLGEAVDAAIAATGK
ncbi:Adenosylmethionine-8-amino-7-oxononanoate aminotransferase [Enhydrobacter aerosaccus]|uniref:Adenosylmethionine-8-amino-7-oxononanoate aminotransferase n=1 Tax=Enhydrobacter aerosaccus TaxID=225324 RepID=A0A1T4NFS4_9HYPH|nr:aspartate aminotransferase family protein [Enhydrobacter aerosaccus]SJZ78102.1 Adenosylmethionine-8-amino-7-oxononanoate aminotransferase [Enhydrobacter aerosaccus]